MKGLHQVFFVLCGALLILSRPTAAGEDELVILESEGPIIVEGMLGLGSTSGSGDLRGSPLFQPTALCRFN